MRYAYSDKLNINFVLRYEKFEAQDWALAGVTEDTIPNVLTMGAAPYDYDLWAAGISIVYKVDPDKE